jgi:repressor LexA
MNKGIGEIIRELRKSRGWTQGKLEDISHVKRSTISLIEKRKTAMPDTENMDKLAKAFKMTVDDLLSLRTKEKTASLKMLEVIEIQVKGVVPVGYPFIEEENAIGVLTLPQEEMKTVKDIESLYALRIQGESLSGDGIHDGDYIIVNQDYGSFVNDKVYVVRIGEEVTVKHVHRENGKVQLVPSSPEYPIMEFKNIEIIGRAFRYTRGGDI